METSKLWFAGGLLLIAFAVGPNAACAQTTPAEQSASSSHAVLTTEKDYNDLRVQANRLTEQELGQLRVKALAGDMRAQLLLGLAYQQGCPGAVQDSAQALKWYNLAADQGSSIAATQIAVSYDPAE